MRTNAYKTLLLVLFCAFLCACVIPPSPPLEKGGKGEFEPARIISLKPNITEILFALGVGDKVVGVTTWCDWPAEVKGLPKVADYININTEKIIALKPDLVVGSEENSVREPFGVLENAGIKTLLVPFRTVGDLYSSVEKIAEAVGKKEAGEMLVNKIKLDIKDTNPPIPPFSKGGRKAPMGPRPFTGQGGITDLGTYALTHLRTVLILVGHRPLVAAGKGTFYDDVLKLIGAENIVAGGVPYPTLNTEFILAKNPDVIIDLAMGSEEHYWRPDFSREKSPLLKQGIQSPDLPEILKDKVVQFDISAFRAGPRLPEAVKKLQYQITKLK